MPNDNPAALAQELRRHCTTLRQRPIPLVQLIPLMQRAADALEATLPRQAGAGALSGARDETAMVDAAMVEMQNIVPPLRRSECARLIHAAMGTALQRQAAEPVANETAFKAMTQAHSLCPTDMPHLDRMRWMAAYMLAAFFPSPAPDARPAPPAADAAPAASEPAPDNQVPFGNSEALLMASEPASGAVQVLREALEKIERWVGEFPETDRTWPDGSPVSYGAAYGSNGERDYMRGVARAALSSTAATVMGAGSEEPFWHAVISEQCPVINKAIRRADVAEEHAQKWRDLGYGGVEVVPLYRATPTPVPAAAMEDKKS